MMEMVKSSFSENKKLWSFENTWNVLILKNWDIASEKYISLNIEVIRKCKRTGMLMIFGTNFWRRNFSLLACHSSKLARCQLQIVKLLVTRFKICLLLVAEVAYCKNSLVTCCKIHPLQKVTRYSLWISLVKSQQKIISHSLKQSQVHKIRWKI